MMDFCIVDAFTDKPFGGNPAGVVFLPEGGSFPDDAFMRSLAAELRYSETAFVRRESENEYSLRYFTVTDEVELCGHATLAAFSVIFGKQDAGASCLAALTKAGRLAVEKHGDLVFMDMATPADISVIRDGAALKEIYACAGLEPSQGAEWPPEVISTGLPDIILPVASREALNAMRPDFPMMSALSERMGVTGVHAFALGKAASSPQEETVAYCRNFAPLYGIDEEAATGTANGALTWYLHKRGLMGGLARYVQGEAMGRPSTVYGRLSRQDEGQAGATGGGARVQIGGSCVLVAWG
ncbi:MAG: PhzF family phenazine biosynthesis protein, partial [Clostridiales Family XIII bacterium]|nr:PhzF family phenazine biosynthesis protein [Clostridiales Family XIII bacterium]